MSLMATPLITCIVFFHIILLLQKTVTTSAVLHQKETQSQSTRTQRRNTANDHHWTRRDNEIIGWKADTFSRSDFHGNQSKRHSRDAANDASSSGSKSYSNRAIPAFEYPDYQNSCDEDVPLGARVITGVKLVNLPSNPTLKFQVDNGNFSTQWDGNVLNIITQTKLDADDNAGFYQFVLTALVLLTNEKATATIRISTKNTNDEAPRFTQPSYTASIDETAAPNTLVATVIATDKDGDKVTYAFGDGTTLRYMFKIDKNTGVISLYGSGNKIEFTQDSYDLVVKATDDGSCCPSSTRPTHTTSVTVTINIIDINDHKPVFDECAKYNAAVQEHKPIGTIFIQVKATDADRGRNGQVTYSIVTQRNEQAKFKIDTVNGEVKTNKDFDREGDDGKSIPLTVKATDKGEPPLEGLCTLQVQILDVNDNAPQFDRTQYSETISKNKNVGDILFHVSASDRDADQNAVIVYSLGPANSPDIQYFDINPDSGRVTMKKQLSKQKFSFYVKATDKGVPPLSSTIPVEIELAVGDVSPPKWEENYSQPIKIQENVTINSVVGIIKAISGISTNKKVIYTLFNGNTPQTNMKSTFVLWEETLGDKTIAQIIVNAPLDYEEINQYNLTIRAENAEQIPLAVEMILQIHLLDVNDERPLFGSTAEISVLEEEPIGTEVFIINAHDNDGTLLFRTVYYSIVAGEGNDNFQVDRVTGKVTTRKVFDRETTNMLAIRILVEDGAPSSHPINKGKPNSNMQPIRIRIGDKNDNPPHFASRLYRSQVKENEDLQHAIITVTATDLDSSSKIQYQLTEGNRGGAFGVNMDTGLIYVAGSIDYETTPLFNLTLVASDGLFTDKTTVQIQVQDVNDLPPEFKNSTYEVFLKEEDSTNLPKSILKVVAIDGDKHRPQEIIYFLTGQGTQEPAAFRVGRTTGIIEVLKALDRDKPHGRPQWRFTVLAADEGGRNGTLYGYAEVKVNLIDINDNAPLFLEPKYEGKVKENVPNPGELALTMTAVDYDDPNEGTNAILTYTIIKNVMNSTVNRPVFKINPDNAEIRTNIAYLDREATARYIIVVKAKDGDDQSATATATIYIEDVNDSPPRFEHKIYQQEIDESFGTTITSDPVLTVKVLDDDLPETNLNDFIILKNSGVGSDMFTIARSTFASDEGVLTVRQPLDYENPTHRKGFKFTIHVDDTGGFSNDPTHTSTAQVIITLRDINDNAPEFLQPFKNVSILENAAEGTTLATFSAVDHDNDGNSAVRYSLDRATNRRRHFQITPDGTVKIHRPLDREQIPLHTLKVLAIDDGTPALTGTATLLVNVLDVNDNAPAFCEDYQGLVMENGPEVDTQVKDVNGKLLVMEACDPDGPDNGPPFTFSLDASASSDIKTKFDLRFQSKGGSKNQGSATLFVREKLDREEQKDYKIPVRISDSGSPRGLTGISTLTVIVGDQNDNGMKDGSTDIEVYLFKGRSQAGIIGHVYADDLDDWDWPDKTFRWEGSAHPQFTLSETTGQITMLAKTREGTYNLYFTVSDQSSTVRATVTIRVYNIPEEAVYKSGSLRIKDSSEEDFISIWDYKNKVIVPSKREKLQSKIAQVMGVDLQNVQVFTVLKSATRGMVDVRFAVHGSPYYEPERLNGILSQQVKELEAAVGIDIEMVGIDDCMNETVKCDASCYNNMTIYTEKPYMITAKRTGLAGIYVFTNATCSCFARENFPKASCDPNPCFNDGQCSMEHNGARCSCPTGYDGPRCQQTTRSFSGDGYAWFAPLKLCEDSHLSLEFLTRTADGLLFYNGPISEPNSKMQLVQDFISLELVGGRPQLLLNLGSGTVALYVNQSQNLADGQWHRLDVVWNPEVARLVVDLCQATASKAKDGEIPTSDRSVCEKSGVPPGYYGYLNVNGPLQLGGVQHPQLQNYKWVYRHGRTPFNGCIRNFIHNSEVYNLASPQMLSVNSKPGCSHTEAICQANDLDGQCQHGTCSSSLISTSRSCLCSPGYHGDQCEHETVPATFYNSSFVRYALKVDVRHYDHLFRSEMQLTYRARWSNASIFSVVGKGKEFVRLEIVNRILRFSFNLKETSRQEQAVSLPDFVANDGYWHTVSILRSGSYASLSVDGGEGKQYGETLLEDQGFNQLLQINENQVVLGLHPEFGTHLASPTRYAKACLDDFRLDRHSYHLPMPPLEKDTRYGSVLDAKVDAGCNSSACVGIMCPEFMECVDLFLVHECRCKPGYLLNEKQVCVDIDECEVLFPGPCLNGGTCVNDVHPYQCICPEGFTGNLCGVIQEKKEIQLGMGGLVAILACLLVAIILLFVVIIIWNRRRKQKRKYDAVAPEEYVKDAIISYNDEGGGEADTQNFNTRLLLVPVEDSVKLSSSDAGTVTPHKDPLQKTSRLPDRDYPDVGDFISDNLSKADDDDDTVPLDDFRLYSYEGGGSSTGSLSSLASGSDEDEQDFEYLSGLGVQFQKLADMYGGGESEED